MTPQRSQEATISQKERPKPMGTNEFLESGQPLTGPAARPEDAEALLAGYLEGRLEAAEAERVEAWLASDPAALDLLLASREALAPPAETEVPARLLETAKAMAGPALAEIAAETAAEPGAAPDALLIAAYLDGTLDEAEQARVENMLAADPEALALMLASRDALDAAPAEAAPEALLHRAQGIVREQPRASESRGGGWLGWLFGGALQPVGLAAAVLLACALGIGLGHSSFANLTAAQSLEAEGFDLGLSGDEIF